ncbi:hypothetical protein B0H67DRAFT_640734 [Lasiosphaeris hirsuta]|uniref:Uncharacterized protein n=1 Tax=Lasiosphaeris hirsuta TaxID=260670 RepID=A0AA40AY85_9PEZI|nr:hypothetical protein B0H67DRAFT_640734 [Lasiosphaeris hirsuta]
MLMELRRSGLGFSEISSEMRLRFGINISPNALVKRAGKLKDQYLEPLPEAIRNAMPEVMGVIQNHLEKTDLRKLSAGEKKAVAEVLKDLPQEIPKLVLQRMLRKLNEAHPGYYS